MSRYDDLPPMLPPRGLCREAAAAYAGVSASTFDKMVKDGTMPPPRRIYARRIWDRHTLDLAFNDLPTDGVDATLNPWDAA